MNVVFCFYRIVYKYFLFLLFSKVGKINLFILYLGFKSKLFYWDSIGIWYLKLEIG